MSDNQRWYAIALATLLALSVLPDQIAPSQAADLRPGNHAKSAKSPPAVKVVSIVYVDKRIKPASCHNYNVSLRRCGRGKAIAYKTLASAARAARPGDTVTVREGTFDKPLAPQHSGTPDSYITFKNFGSETVVISGESLSPAIDLSHRQYLIIAGFTVRDVPRWLRAVNAHYNTIKNNTFRRATDGSGGSKTGIFFAEATYNKVLNNTFEDNPTDGLSLINSDRNLVEGNTFRKAGHALWDIRCGNYNVIRGNYFHNELQKIGEIYDCDGQAGYYNYNATKRNLIEGNDFAYVPSSGNSSPYSGIQFAGQDSIIRQNRFYDTVGPGIQMALYGAEARYNTGNRIFHNVFYGTDFAGVEITNGDTLYDNVFKNNIFMKSVFVANDTRWDWWVNTVNGKPVQVMTGRLDGFVFDTNGFFNTQAGEDWLITYGWRSSSWSEQQNVSWWETNYPQLVTNSIEGDPNFIDEASRDFHLSPGSPMIDRGSFLTRAVGAGTGVTLAVQDASYFYDGYGIPGEVGDEIQLEGQSQTATVVAIDYDNNTLTLDRPVTWSDRQGVALKYNGVAPDVGAFESP